MKAEICAASLSPDFGIRVSASLSRLGLGIFDSSQYIIFPGFCDVHVHFREPGFSYKETIASGSMAAAWGGYTAVCAMPNLNPVPDSMEHLRVEQEMIDSGACIHVYPYAAITVGEMGERLVDIEALAPHVCAFSDDGHGVQHSDIMCAAMKRVRTQGKLIAAHCEVNSLLRGGYIHDGRYAALHHHRGICSESEWGQIARDVELVRQTGCPYHVCHISTKESVAILRQAKAEGLPVSCETAPHYLVLNDMDLQEDGRFKMNPPVRDESDRQALLEGLLDGTIDMVATDHAPHSAEEKDRGLEKSAFGIPGLETAFPILYTRLVEPGILTLDRLVEMLALNPRRRFNLPLGLDYSIWDLHEEYAVDPAEFASMGRATPFAGWRVRGRCMATVCDGKLVYRREEKP